MKKQPRSPKKECVRGLPSLQWGFCTEPFNEEAAPLPKERVRQRPPFSAVGIDLTRHLLTFGGGGR